MLLTKKDKQCLLNWGYLEENIDQIEKAINKTEFLLNFRQKISAKETVELLGRKAFLSGIGRSAFHVTAIREIENTQDQILFDSSALFCKY